MSNIVYYAGGAVLLGVVIIKNDGANWYDFGNKWYSLGINFYHIENILDISLSLFGEKNRKIASSSLIYFLWT